jgi:IS30 family transposase
VPKPQPANDPKISDRIVARYQAGASVREICQAEGISNSFVRKQLKRHGQSFGVLNRMLRQFGEKGQTIESFAAQVADRFHSGTTVDRLATEMQVTDYAVRRLLAAVGVQRFRLRDSIHDYSASDRKRISRLFKSGASVNEITAQTGVKRQLIIRILKEQGVPMRPPGPFCPPPTPQEVTQAVRLYERGLTAHQVAAKLQRSFSVICRLLKENGFDLRSRRGIKRKEIPATTRKLILRLHREGVPMRHIAPQVSVTEYYVVRTVREDAATRQTRPKRKK